MILLRVEVRFCPVNLSSFFNFKSNLELALSTILKERDIDESKHVVVERRCLKI